MSHTDVARWHSPKANGVDFGRNLISRFDPSATPTSGTVELGPQGPTPVQGDVMAPRTREAKVAWSVFERIVAGLLFCVVGLIGLLYLDVIGDLGDIRSDLKGNTAAINETKLEIVRAVGEVKTEIAVTNTKMDTLIEEIRRRNAQ